MAVPCPLPFPSCRHPTPTPRYFAISPKVSRAEREGGEKTHKFRFFPIETRLQSLISVEKPRIYPGLGLAWKLMALILRSCWADSLRVGSVGSTVGKLSPFYSKAKTTGFGAKIGFVGWVPALLLACCVALIKWLNFSGLQFLHLYNGALTMVTLS